jgi:thiosulfate/3-mercaptopyruvate sulfurtransferase
MSSSPSHNDSPTESDLLVTPDWLEGQLEREDIAIIDVRSADEYAEGHVPNAIHLELSQWTHAEDGVPGMLLDAESFARLVGNAGIGNDTTLIIYDSNWGMPAARVLWSFLRYGHSAVTVLNGGWDAWEEKGLPTSTQTPSPKPVTYTPQPVDEHLAQRSWLKAQSERSDFVVVDTRTPTEYAQGHLPNSVNWDWLNAVPVGEWQAVRPQAEILAELAQLGITPDKEVVTYCRSGARAAHTFLVLRHLGFARVRNYDGSWLDWSLKELGQEAS